MATFDEISAGGILGSGIVVNQMIHNGDVEFFICLRENSTGAVNDVTIGTESGEPVYVFGGERGTRYGVILGTYKFNIPSSHPIAFHTAGKVGVSYNGQNFQGTKRGLDGNNYQFFWGEVVVTVTADFGLLSYESWTGSYLGGFRHIDYTLNCRTVYNTSKAKSSDAALSSPTTVYVNSNYSIVVEPFDVFTYSGEASISLRQTNLGSGGSILGGTAPGIKNPIISTVRMIVGGGATIEGGVLENPIVKSGKTAGLLSSPTGGVVWQNANGVLREDELQSATALFNTTSGATNFLYISNFTFDDLPEFAIPTGCSVRITKSSSTGEIFDENIRLILNESEVVLSDNKALYDFWPRIPTSVTYGGENDTWGFDLTRANVVNPYFGIIVSILGDPGLSSTAAIDFIELSIYYYQVVQAVGSGGSSLSGSAATQVIYVSYDATGGASGSGLILISYDNIDAQGGVLLSGESIPDTSNVAVTGAISLLAGSADVYLITDISAQTIILLRAEAGQNIVNDVTVRPIGISWKGDWEEKIYPTGSTVRYSGSFYTAKQTSDETINPVDDIENYSGEKWELYSGPLFYVFGSDYGSYGATSGTYLFNVPESYPIAFLVEPRPEIQFTGEQSIGSRTASDGRTYAFFYGICTLTIGSGWNRAFFSYESWENGFLGGLNNIVYSPEATGQNTDLVLGGDSNVSVFAEKISESGAACSGDSIVYLENNTIIESLGVILSGDAVRSDDIDADGGLTAGGEQEVNQIFNVQVADRYSVASGTAVSAATYLASIELQAYLVSGSGIIGIQPSVGNGSAVLSGECIQLVGFTPLLLGFAQISGSYVLQQTYNSVMATGYARVAPKSREERIRRLTKTKLNYGLSMASENILNRVPEDQDKILRSTDSIQPITIEETSYRLQHEPGWCDIGDACGSAYLPQIIKTRQGRYLPSKEKRAVASRQIAAMTEG